MSGYALIHRTLLGHPAFRNDAEAMAFAWLVLKASWRPAAVRYKGHKIMLGRGQVAISQRDMAAALDRDKGWVERLCKRLTKEAMIETSAKAGVAVITICNYDEYQQLNGAGEAAGKARPAAANGADARQTQGTEQYRENIEDYSVANATGAEAPPNDPEKVFWANAKAMLQPHCKGDAGKVIGAWLRDHGKELVTAALNAAQLEKAVNPIEYCQGYFRRHRGEAKAKPEPGSVEANAAYCRRVAEDQRREREWREAQGGSPGKAFDERQAAGAGR